MTVPNRDALATARVIGLSAGATAIGVTTLLNVNESFRLALVFGYGSAVLGYIWAWTFLLLRSGQQP